MSLVRKSVVVLLTAAALLIAGVATYTYVRYQQLDDGVATDDVISPRPSASSAPPVNGMNILLIGLDSRTDNHGRPLPQAVLDELRAGEPDGQELADTMILVHLPKDSARPASAVSFPRDSYVDIAGGFGKHKINSAYARAKNAAADRLRAEGVTDDDRIARESATEGRRNLIATISALTGVGIDHYAEVNLYGFSEITKAIGGIDVCLNNPVHDSYSGADFPAGPQTLSGVDALKFVRQRHGLPGGDLDRIRRQQAFLAGVRDKITSAGMLTDPAATGRLIDAVSGSVLLDQGWDVADFARRIQALAGSSVEFQTIPTGRSDLSTPDGSAVQVDPAQVKEFAKLWLADPPMNNAAGGGGAAAGPTCVN
ncbi:LCP family protein [Amycolatopsis nigrescens]|uniref:LCP family protein n=1 Tax=Amycolatopsis nigrescens TaxID=381445 RepID=UPI000368C1F7|nr:LCP family protein [Amycolatopsis nigrescens]